MKTRGTRSYKDRSTGTKRKRSAGNTTPSINLRLKLFLRRNGTVLRTGLVFTVCLLVCIIAYPALLTSDAMNSLRAFTAGIAGFVVSLFGISTQVSGTLIYSSRYSIDVVGECTGIVPILIFVSAVLAYPSGFKQKLLGIALGVTALHLVNMARIISLFCIGCTFPEMVDIAHYLVWQAIMVLAAIIIWLVWMARVAHVARQ